MHIIVAFPIDEADGVLIEGESAEFFGLVLINAAVEITGHPDVKRAAGAALHEVHVVNVLCGHRYNSVIPSGAGFLRGVEGHCVYFGVKIGDVYVMGVTIGVENIPRLHSIKTKHKVPPLRRSSPSR